MEGVSAGELLLEKRRIQQVCVYGTCQAAGTNAFRKLPVHML
jgi:hypothetical protein